MLILRRAPAAAPSAPFQRFCQRGRFHVYNMTGTLGLPFGALWTRERYGIQDGGGGPSWHGETSWLTKDPLLPPL